MVHTLDAGALEGLGDGSVAAIEVRGFAATSECRWLARRVLRHAMPDYAGVSPPIGRLGVTVFEHRTAGRASYFANVVKAEEGYRRLVAGGFDPMRRVQHWLAAALGRRPEPAIEPAHGRYFAGLVRRMDAGTRLHVDHAPSEARGWSAAQVSVQLAWNVYLQVPEAGGALEIHDRRWQPPDEVYRDGSSYGYHPRVVAGARTTVVQPRVGALVVFNTREYHRVLPASGPRITCTSALGLMPDGRWVLWS